MSVVIHGDGTVEGLLGLAGCRVHTYDITETPTGEVQATDFELPLNAVMVGVVLKVTVPEVTAATKELRVAFNSQINGTSSDPRTTFQVGLVGIAGIQDTAFAFTGPNVDALDRTVYYSARGSDFGEFRGQLKFLYIDYDDLV